ncbi:MAG: hypothetical protein JOS17DRAFT_167535 [Linnemannia elongata]|nr:MAG: hypothetical protein JOS17DRAFT_167535 [Linnemannia elongata]
MCPVLTFLPPVGFCLLFVSALLLPEPLRLRLRSRLGGSTERRLDSCLAPLLLLLSFHLPSSISLYSLNQSSLAFPTCKPILQSFQLRLFKSSSVGPLFSSSQY